jgi:precorrin-3B synthase
MNAPFRRGACPGLSQPMRTGDGLLVRLTPTGATIRPEAFIALCAAARSCGNGVIEVTSRGSIQVRGLTERSVERLAAMIGRIDLPVSDGPPVLCDCLAGLDGEEVLDAGALAAQLRGAIASVSFTANLEPKVSVVVDGGGALHVDGVPADVRLRAMASDGRVYLHVSVGGDAAVAQPIGAVASEHAVEAALRMLDVIAAGRARARAIVAGAGAGAFRRAIADIRLDLTPPPLRPPSDPIGTHALRDNGMALGFALAFGHADSTALEALARAAASAGGSGLRTAPGRALLAIGIGKDRAAHVVASAEELGFIVRAEDPRRQIVACAGAPICAAAEIPARALAPGLAGRVAMAGRDAPMVHVSGCAKGCACARSAPVTVVGLDGRCGMVVNGSARDRPLATLTPEALPGALSRVAETVRRLRVGDESAADVLSRLDRAQIVRLIHGEATGA